ncbi:MAG: amidohydrolase family protein [Gammaproteobacteria bacterium]|nr:amidohydrolase family protein [Gammaproteobacteria bacterium]
MKIALEEHFITPGLLNYCVQVMPNMHADEMMKIIEKLSDLGDMRLDLMNKSGIDFSILSLSGPGVQAELNTRLAIKLAKEANDFLASQIIKQPTRYGGFAHLPMQDANVAADELERSVKELGFLGAMVNGHTNGVYLDAPEYDVFWERMQALDVPLYLHPTDSFVKPYVLDGCDELLKCNWEWNFETASHFLRLVYAGVFDRFPNLKIILGHMGEMLPFELWRLDSRTKLLAETRPLQKAPSEYLKKHLYVTTSGQCDDAPLICSLLSLGEEHVLFSTDYPYEDATVAAAWIKKADISAIAREKICHLNAKVLMRIGDKCVFKDSKGR